MTKALALALMLVQGGAAKHEQRTVTKSSVVLVKEPSFLATPVSKPILRGERIDVEVPSARGWFNARHAGASGYIHLTYLSDRAIAFKVTRAELASDTKVSGAYNLAVGGFTEGVESSYRKEHPDTERGFKELDPFMKPHPTGVANTPDPEGLARFISEGHLRVPQSSEAEK